MYVLPVNQWSIDMTSDMHEKSLESRDPEQSAPMQPWELALGMKWFSRLGIVALLIGFVLALKYTFAQIDPAVAAWAKIITGWVVAGGLFGLGTRLHRNYAVLGRVLQGGGMTLGYLSLYGMFFIPEVRLVHDHVYAIGWPLLCAYIALMIVTARRLESRTMALLSLAFGYYTASFSGSQSMAFLSTGVLAAASVFLSLYKDSWRVIGISGMVGTLLTFLYWNVMAPAPEANAFAVVPAFGVYEDQKLYLGYHFLLFHLGNLIPSRNSSGLLNVLNSFVFYVLFLLTKGETWPDGLFELMIAAVHGLSYAFIVMRRPDERHGFYAASNLILFLSFLGLATIDYFSGVTRVAVVAAQALCIGLMSNRSLESSAESWVLRFAAYFFWAVAVFDGVTMAWGSLSTVSLLLTVGMVSLTGIILENRVFSRMLSGETDQLVQSVIILAITNGLFGTALVYSQSLHWMTLSFVLTGLVMLLGGFGMRERKYRWAGLLWFLCALFRLVVVDLATLDTPYKIALFMGLGVTLLAGSYVYHRFGGRLTSNTSSKGDQA